MVFIHETRENNQNCNLIRSDSNNDLNEWGKKPQMSVELDFSTSESKQDHEMNFRCRRAETIREYVNFSKSVSVFLKLASIPESILCSLEDFPV